MAEARFKLIGNKSHTGATFIETCSDSVIELREAPLKAGSVLARVQIPLDGSARVETAMQVEPIMPQML